MKKIVLALVLGAAVLLTLSATNFAETETDLSSGFITGNPEIASINQMSFGPEGILFLGDSKTRLFTR